LTLSLSFFEDGCHEKATLREGTSSDGHAHIALKKNEHAHVVRKPEMPGLQLCKVAAIRVDQDTSSSISHFLVQDAICFADEAPQSSSLGGVEASHSFP
jgi:hypothetical protein